MKIAISTRWNAGEHLDGEAMLSEILALGVDQVELGYDLRLDLVPGVQKVVASGAVKVVSLHNFCPVPVAAPRGHPEIYTLASVDASERERAVLNTGRTLRFAAEMGARAVVAHAGNVAITKRSPDLLALCAAGRMFDSTYERIKLKLQVAREKKVGKQLDFLRQSLDRLAPVMEETGVVLALENLPTWEAIPTEVEMEILCREWADRKVRCWHDIGHGRIRELMGFINLERWLERLAPWMAGVHIHDVRPPAIDHAMPPGGLVDFASLKPLVRQDILKVLEPAPRTPAEMITEALRFLEETWGDASGENQA